MSNNPFKRNNSKIRYEKMCRRLEEAQTYDVRGTYHLYKCKNCGRVLLTVCIDKGFLPEFMHDGKCKHSGECYMRPTKIFKSLEEAPSLPCYPWFRPTYKQFRKLDDIGQNMVKEGWLLLDVAHTYKAIKNEKNKSNNFRPK